jgi:seryl-tRNA synthetase
MHNIKWIRENPEAFDVSMKKRGIAPVSDVILKHDQAKRESIFKLNELQNQANQIAKQIGELMRDGKRDEAESLKNKSKEIKEKIAELNKSVEEEEMEGGSQIDNLLLTLPNILDKSVPEGLDETSNMEIRSWGEPRDFSFKPRMHDDLGEYLGIMEFEQTAKIAGARFTSLGGQLSRLERALSNFMLDIHTREFGYKEISVPLLVRPEALLGTGQLPKFEEDLFKTTDNRFLIPTAEVSLTNLVREKIIDEETLPIRLVASTPCFRSEAGAAGRDTRGMIRQHQFNKVELVSIVSPEQSIEEHERLTNCAEEILKRLEMPYRVMLLCAGDTGFGSVKTYDIEVWMAGQECFREISSCSNFRDFQARRMHARSKLKGDKETKFVHTLNGSGLAIGRALIAILENYQQEDGTIQIPKALISYMDGETLIRHEKDKIFG